MAVALFHEARRAWRCLLAPLLLALITSCSGKNDADTLFDDHRQLLQTTLGVEAEPATQPENIAAFPDQDERLFDIPDIREGLLDVYALRECEITSLIAERNNQLGKVAPPSQRWLYELEIWRRLHACWNSDVPDSLDDEDRDRLQHLTESKTRRLPKASWNALFGSSEWVDNFSRASEPLEPQDSPPMEASLDALDYLRQATLNQFNPNWHPDSSTLEGHLKTLQRTPLTARFLRALQLAAVRLDESATLMDTALTESRACPMNDATTLSQEHIDQEHSHYIERLARDAGRWLQAINDLLDVHTVSRPAVEAYRRHWLSLTHDDAPWTRFQKARQRYESSRRALRARCDTGGDRKDEEGRT